MLVLKEHRESNQEQVKAERVVESFERARATDKSEGLPKPQPKHRAAQQKLALLRTASVRW
jgi:hypothetical protein